MERKWEGARRGGVSNSDMRTKKNALAVGTSCAAFRLIVALAIIPLLLSRAAEQFETEPALALSTMGDSQKARVCLRVECRGNSPRECDMEFQDAACDDGDACTLDRCDRMTGVCVSERIAPPITNDRCEVLACDAVLGWTKVDERVDCDDGIPGTEDWCDPFIGCMHRLIRCPEGKFGDAVPRNCKSLDANDCRRSIDLNCSDQDPCTVDRCDPATGRCVHSQRCGQGKSCDAKRGGVCGPQRIPVVVAPEDEGRSLGEKSADRSCSACETVARRVGRNRECDATACRTSPDAGGRTLCAFDSRGCDPSGKGSSNVVPDRCSLLGDGKSGECQFAVPVCPESRMLSDDGGRRCVRYELDRGARTCIPLVATCRRSSTCQLPLGCANDGTCLWSECGARQRCDEQRGTCEWMVIDESMDTCYDGNFCTNDVYDPLTDRCSNPSNSLGDLSCDPETGELFGSSNEPPSPHRREHRHCAFKVCSLAVHVGSVGCVYQEFSQRQNMGCE